MNVKFQTNCENTGKILKISCIRFHFVKFDNSTKVSDMKDLEKNAGIYNDQIAVFTGSQNFITWRFFLLPKHPSIKLSFAITSI